MVTIDYELVLWLLDVCLITQVNVKCNAIKLCHCISAATRHIVSDRQLIDYRLCLSGSELISQVSPIDRR